jgi:hypothetical protein
MGFLDKIFNRGGSRIVLDKSEFARDFGNLVRCLTDGGDEPKFSQSVAYALALTLAEINFPIDCIADKVATLKWDIMNESGDIVKNPPKSVKRLLERPNVFSSLSQMVYDAVFILLSDGNLVAARNKPSALAGDKYTPDTISSVNILYPGSYIYHETHEVSHLFASSLSDLIAKVDYHHGRTQVSYMPDALAILGVKGMPDGSLKYPSPLMAAKHNIDNLLVVYQARYRAYTKNPMGLLLSPRSTPGGDIAAVLNNSDQRDQIVADISNRNGITGYDLDGKEKRMWTIAGVPMQAVKTLATISELQPFEETREDALAIAGVFNVDKDLVPSKDGTTFTNKEAAEAGLYTGAVAAMAKDVFGFMTRLMCLDRIGLRIEPNITDIPVLQRQRFARADADNKVIDLLVKMRENNLANEADVKQISESIINNYKL